MGACDGLTGLLLIAVPSWTLDVMGIPSPPDENVYLRWIGVFVGSVGLFYLYPFTSGDPAGRRARLRVVLECTALARAAVAAFVAVEIALGALGWQWYSVALTDLVLASIQVALLRRGMRIDVPA